jgi:hypothetical protein
MSNYYGDLERTIVENIVPEEAAKSSDDLVCECCGSDRVQSKCWVEMKSDKIIDSCDDGDIYCPDCEDLTSTILRREFKDE